MWSCQDKPRSSYFMRNHWQVTALVTSSKRRGSRTIIESKGTKSFPQGEATIFQLWQYREQYMVSATPQRCIYFNIKLYRWHYLWHPEERHEPTPATQCRVTTYCQTANVISASYQPDQVLSTRHRKDVKKMKKNTICTRKFLPFLLLIFLIFRYRCLKPY